MILGRKIPRFSPSFSISEVRTIIEYLLSGGDREDIKSKFEREFAQYIGVKRAVILPSARMGLSLLLKFFGIKEGDEILLPAFHFYSIPSIIHAMGMKPVFVDISRKTLLIDPDKIEGKITKRTRAIIPTHLYGNPCPMDDILDIARRRGLIVIEDCAQATGATYGGKRVGSFGNGSYYTFGLTKNITTLRGGMVTTDDEEIADRIQEETLSHKEIVPFPLLKDILTGLLMSALTRGWIYPFTLFPVTLLMNIGEKDRLHHIFEEKEVLYEGLPESFLKSKPRGIQAMVGMSQLKRLDILNNLRARNGRFLFENLKNLPSIEVPVAVEKGEPIYMSFPILHKEPDRLKRILLRMGVDTDRGYMKDFSTHPFFRGEGSPCPVSKLVEERILHIPVFPYLKEKDLIHICESIRRAIFKASR